jgi:hypothetical protein
MPFRDAASVREGLLHVLGAGITNVTLAPFPTPLPLTLASRVVLEPRELQPGHLLRVRLLDNMEREVAKFQVMFEVLGEIDRREEAALPAAVPLQGLVVTQPGKYLVEVTLDNRAIGSFPVQVKSPSE